MNPINGLSTKFVLLASGAIIAGNALHRWVVRPLLAKAGLVS